MDPQLTQVVLPLRSSYRPADPAHRAVKDLRNRLLVFYSASAWARSRTGECVADVRGAVAEIERSVESLRAALQLLAAALEPSLEQRAPDLTTRVFPEAARSIARFLEEAERSMCPLRRGLALCGTDGAELLADLEDTLIRVRDAARLLAG